MFLFLLKHENKRLYNTLRYNRGIHRIFFVSQRGVAPPTASESVYVAVATFKNTMGDGIDLFEGEELTVLEKTENGWWFVAGQGGEGWAPSSYIEKQEVQQQVRLAYCLKY